MEYLWTLRSESDNHTVTSLAAALGIDTSLAAMLVQRGIHTFEQARDFFRPQLEHLHDPFLMCDMEAAVTRIEKAIGQEEKVLVFGDYDVDGTTAVSLVYLFLKQQQARVDYYIPDRYKEGYGISFQGIDYAAEHGFSLIIALDCGIKSVKHVEYAREKGVDFIICDHHLPGEELPPAVAVLDPKRKDCQYPYKELSGCGVGFKLCQAYCIKHNIPEETMYSMLDLLCVSIASDIVHITDENRILAYYGLKKINEDPRPGIRALLDNFGKKKNYTITDVVFSVGPRINAAGRIADAKAAVRLLIAEEETEIKQFAEILNTRNTERKGLDQSITQEALEMISAGAQYNTRKSTVVFKSGWHKGVVGIVASRLIENHYKPTIVLTESEGKATGSARSVNGFDIHTAIEKCEHLLLQFGGHTHAAGLTLDVARVEEFILAFEKVVAESIGEESLYPQLFYEQELLLSDITPRFTRILQQFAPFGPGNMNPIFVSRGVADTGWAKIVGTNHLKFTARQQDTMFSAIGFGFGNFYEDLRKGKLFDICYHIEENEYKEKVYSELRIVDMKLSENN